MFLYLVNSCVLCSPVATVAQMVQLVSNSSFSLVLINHRDISVNSKRGYFTRPYTEENSFQFNGENSEIHGTAMGTKMVVASWQKSKQKCLLNESKIKPKVWKRYIDDVFSLWHVNRQDIDLFIEQAYTFYPTIKFTAEISEKEITFLDTVVYKAERFLKEAIYPRRQNSLQADRDLSIYTLFLCYTYSKQSTQNPPNRSNSPFRATETTIHSNRGTFAFILSFNLDIPRYKFTILRLFNILPYISLYFEHKQTHCLCGPPVVKTCRFVESKNGLSLSPIVAIFLSVFVGCR